MKKMREVTKLLVLDLYSGTQSWGKAFRAKGHKVLSVELNPMFTEAPYNYEQWTISIADVTAKEVIKRLGGVPDVICVSPLCTTHSIAAISTHRSASGGFGKTQLEKKRNNILFAKSDKARIHDQLLIKTLHLIQDLKPKLYYIENPRGGMRKSALMQGLMYRYTITYCSYGDNSMKPTDIWTNHLNPEFKEVCHNGNKDCHHQPAPRGSKTGTQGKKGNLERSIIPQEFCEHIVKISEELILGGIMKDNKVIDHEYTTEIVCPYCGCDFSDSYEHEPGNEDIGLIDCTSCDESFYATRNITIDYCTEKATKGTCSICGKADVVIEDTRQCGFETKSVGVECCQSKEQARFWVLFTEQQNAKRLKDSDK